MYLLSCIYEGKVFTTKQEGYTTEVKLIPDHLIEKELKTDIYFELNDIKIAIEIQIKNMHNPLF